MVGAAAAEGPPLRVGRLPTLPCETLRSAPATNKHTGNKRSA